MPLLTPSRPLDRDRIQHLLRIGLFAAALGLAADMCLGWVDNLHAGGFEDMVAAYATVSDARLYASAVLGLFGIALECLASFGILRLFADGAPGLAHAYRAGLLGMLAFGACGVHVPCVMAVWSYKHLAAAGAADPLGELVPWALGFMLPAFVLFLVAFWVAAVTQARAFLAGATPYPRAAALFSVPAGMAAVFALTHFALPDVAPVNAVACGWISVGELFQFAGLLLAMPPATDPAWKD